MRVLQLFEFLLTPSLLKTTQFALKIIGNFATLLYNQKWVCEPRFFQEHLFVWPMDIVVYARASLLHPMTRLFTQEAALRNNEKTVQPADDFLSFTLCGLSLATKWASRLFSLLQPLPGNLSHNNTHLYALYPVDGHRRARDNYFWPPEKPAGNLQAWLGVHWEN